MGGRAGERDGERSVLVNENLHDAPGAAARRRVAAPRRNWHGLPAPCQLRSPAMPATAAFFYGTLRDAGLRRIVLGADLPARPAALPGHRAVAVAGGAWPALATAEGAVAEGLIVDLAPSARARLDYYESLFGYVAGPARADDGTPVLLWRQDSGEEPAGGPEWSLAAWQEAQAGLARLAAEEAMALMGVRDAAEPRARWGNIRSRAQARLFAQGPAPATLRRAAQPQDVAVSRRATPYARFFAVEEYELRHRRFDGGWTGEMNRAVFVSGDAVTVLPYDPARDVVLLIEQFRAGPFARGDANPWLLEPIAGRIDAGETPEDTARREAREEAGADLARLLPVAAYYPTPGAKSEFLHSFIALADLPEAAAGLGGLEEEHEDIRSHVVPFARLMELVATAEITNGPLILTAWALERRRPALRAEAGR
jgi:nudix-type nucleoside diphosphatase (YffH/AdpP family)